MGGYGWQYGQGGGPGWWVVMVIFMILFWTVLVMGAVYSVRHFRGDYHHDHHDHLGHGGPPAHGPVDEDAVEILRTRFAKGEIDEAEFKSRLALLQERR